MPQHTQHSLVYVLLLWTALNTIIQVIFITLFFTVGRNELSLNSSTISSTIEPKHNMRSQYPPNDGLLGKGKMISFQATAADKKAIKWKTASQDTYVITDSGEQLMIQEDGYYFLNLQVTLSANENESHKLEHTVRLMLDSKVLLEGWINTKTNSTGLLGKVQALSAGANLLVAIDPPTGRVSTNESVTHLDIIYMEKP